MGKLRGRQLMIGAFLASTALGAPASAQYLAPSDTPPVHSRIDEFNVDLVSHQIAFWNYGSVSIGPGGPGSLTWVWSTSNRLGSDLSNSLIGGGSTTQFSVVVAGVTKTFTLSGTLGTGTLSNDLGTGETLTYDSSTGRFTYTVRNGAVLLFGSTTGAYGYLNGYPISLTYPGGEQITWNRDASNVVRSITSNLGYQLRPTYDSTNQAWTKIVLFNMANVACDPLAVSCTIAGTWPTIDFTAGTINGQPVLSTASQPDPNTGGTIITETIPQTSTTSRTVVYKEGSDRKVTSVTDGNGTWTYTFPQPNFAPVALRTASDRSAYPDETQWNTNTGAFTQIKTSEKDGYRQYDYTYDANQRVSTTAVDGIVTTYTYDGRGNVTQASTAPKSGGTDAPIVTKAVFPSTCTNPKTCDQPTSTTDANNNTTDYTYDPNSGGVATVTQPAQPNGIRPSSSYTYTTKNAQWLSGSGSTVTGGNVYRVTAISRCITQSTCAGTADEVKITSAYSVSDGLEPASTTVQSGNGSIAATTGYTYSTLGDLATIDGPLSGSADTTYYSYDNFRRIIGMVGPGPDTSGNRRAVSLGYNYENKVTSTNLGTSTNTDVVGMTVLQSDVTAYNAQGLKSQDSLYDKNNSLAGVTQYSYTPSRFGECVVMRVSTSNIPTSACTQSVGNLDHIVKYVYTGASSPAEVRYGFVSDSQAADLVNTWSNSVLASQSDGNGNVTNYTYDDFDRLRSTCYPNPNRSTDCEVRTYDPVGNVTSRRLRDASTTLSNTYDALNRLKTKVLPEGTVAFGYDNLGHITSMAQGTTTLSFTYDPLGRNLTQTGPQGTVASAWDVAGRRTGLTYPDNFALTYDYLVTGELNHIYDPAGTLATYAYDSLGNRTSVSYANGTSQSYAHDTLYRLSQLTNTLGSSSAAYNLCATFGYNAASDLTSRTQKTANCTSTSNAYGWSGATGYSRTYSVNALNQYTSDSSTSFGYDSVGNLSQSGSTFYCYSSENRLIKVGTDASCSSPTSSLAYDPAGRLAAITKSGTTTNFAFDGLNLIAEYNGSSLSKRYVFGANEDEPIVSYDPAGNRIFMVSDERGSITAFTDNSGTVNGVINGYDEYGIPNTDASGHDQDNGRFRYTGQVWLSEIELAYYKNRIYSPTLGRFLQTDPIGYDDGPNWYAYAHNDPVNGSDSLGLDCTTGPYPDGGCGLGNGTITVIAFRPGAGSFVGDDGPGPAPGSSGPYPPGFVMSKLKSNFSCGTNNPDSLTSNLATVRAIAGDVGRVADVVAMGAGVVGIVFPPAEGLAGLALGVSRGADAVDFIASVAQTYHTGDLGYAGGAIASYAGGRLGGRIVGNLGHGILGRTQLRMAGGRFGPNAFKAYQRPLETGGTRLGNDIAGSVCDQ